MSKLKPSTSSNLSLNSTTFYLQGLFARSLDLPIFRITSRYRVRSRSSASTFLAQTTVRCPCRRQKKDWPCTDVRAAQAKSGNQTLELLACDKECQKVAEQRRAAEAKKVKDEPREEQSPRSPVEERPRGRRRGRRRDEEAREQRVSDGLVSLRERRADLRKAAFWQSIDLNGTYAFYLNCRP